MRTEEHAARRSTTLWPLACIVMLASALAGQRAATTQPPRSQAASGASQPQPSKPKSPAKPDKNSGATAPTHVSKTQLPPLAAWQFVKNGNAVFVQSQRHAAGHEQKTAGARHVTKTHHGASAAAAKHVASRAKRPAGANKYVCAVVACADASCDIPALLGLARKDVLVLRLAGPFIHAEAVALLDRTIKKHSTSLILVLSHHDCESLRIRTKGRDDALDHRLAAVRSAARSQRRTLPEVIGAQQRELLLASSRTMRDLVRSDRLRVIPGVIDTATGAIQWLQRRAQELPLSPVK